MPVLHNGELVDREPVVGRPVIGLPVVGLPVVGLPTIGLPVVGLLAVGRPVTGPPTVGLPVAGLPVTGSPITCLPIAEVDHADLRAPDRAVPIAILHRHAVHDHAMKGAVAGHERRSFRAGELAPGIVQRLVRQVRVQPGERGPQALPQHDLAVIAAHGIRRIGRDVGTAGDGPAERREPAEGGVLDVGFGDTGRGFGDAAHPAGSAGRWTMRRIIGALPLSALSAMDVTSQLRIASGISQLKFRDSPTEMDSRFRGNDGQPESNASR